jgi:hypothetical protein
MPTYREIYDPPQYNIKQEEPHNDQIKQEIVKPEFIQYAKAAHFMPRRQAR